LALAAWLVRLLKQRFGEIAPLQVARFALFALTVLFIALFFVRNGRLFLSAIGLIITVIYLVIAVTPELLVGFAPTELRGRFLALYFVVAMFGAIISPIVVGALSDRLHVGRAGLGDSYTGAGIINAGVAAALFALCVPRLRAVVVTPEETRNRERGG
jgi:MFS family permease